MGDSIAERRCPVTVLNDLCQLAILKRFSRFVNQNS